MDDTYLARNVARVRAELEAASAEAIAAGRTTTQCLPGGEAPTAPGGEAPILMAAIKSATVDEINHLHRHLGVHDVGENRVQQLLERYESLDREGLRIHFIGTLQRNKVKYIIDKVDMIQSLDSEPLAREIQRQATRVGRTVDVLIEINSGREEQKSGISPEVAEALALAVTGGEYPHLRLRGFMTMAPVSDEAGYRRYFSETRTLACGIWERLRAAGRVQGEPVLSMGMSDSYIPAAAEGATLVRVGRGLFAGRPEAAEADKAGSAAGQGAAEL